MTQEQMTSFLTLIFPAILSIVVAFITSYYTTKLELRKVPYEIQKTYSESLQKIRIEVYPKLYFEISDLIKKMNNRTVEIHYLKKWLHNYLELDSKYAIYLSGAAANENYRFYSTIAEIVSDYEQLNKKIDSNFYNRLYNSNPESVETNLKKDIGVYIVEFDPKLAKVVKGYGDVERIYAEKKLL